MWAGSATTRSGDHEATRGRGVTFFYSRPSYCTSLLTPLSTAILVHEYRETNKTQRRKNQPNMLLIEHSKRALAYNKPLEPSRAHDGTTRGAMGLHGVLKMPARPERGVYMHIVTYM